MSSFVYQKRPNGGFPGCCICGIGFEIDSDDSDDLDSLDTYGNEELLRKHAGLYPIQKLLKKRFFKNVDWCCLYRVFLHSTGTERVRISGMAAHIVVDPNHQQPPEAVPQTMGMGEIGYLEKYKDRLIVAVGLDQDDDTSSNSLVGYHFHTSCGVILARHAIVSEGLELAAMKLILLPPDLSLLPEEAWQENTYEKRVLNDPANIENIEYLINRARIRTRARFHFKGRFNRRQNRLCYLPVEILYLVMDYLSTDDLENVQTSMKYYLGDTYWRARVPIKLFHEVRSIWDETLDWQFLCLQLEWLSETPDLAFRRYIVERLDLLQASLGQV
ncbi:hypothetical protein BDV30DRAFT_237416 [Aspergillus minisclerotigenes]|uniref:F-box domain-containing protein n=1 Tax=Aspergillus minisclerotigenes TaxID=656917 RepID=A0A5N6J948_9EURO|nr:hypothetical protein BDV30DRAFT_237416 [Aspergillus minisclerotigenes]